MQMLPIWQHRVVGQLLIKETLKQKLCPYSSRHLFTVDTLFTYPIHFGNKPHFISN